MSSPQIGAAGDSPRRTRSAEPHRIHDQLWFEVEGGSTSRWITLTLVPEPRNGFQVQRLHLEALDLEALERAEAHRARRSNRWWTEADADQGTVLGKGKDVLRPTSTCPSQPDRRLPCYGRSRIKGSEKRIVPRLEGFGRRHEWLLRSPLNDPAEDLLIGETLDHPAGWRVILTTRSLVIERAGVSIELTQPRRTLARLSRALAEGPTPSQP